LSCPRQFRGECGLSRGTEAWATLHSDTSRPFAKPANGRIAVKVINHLGDEVMKVFRV
jgi:adenine-specific DNA-methyltransferase